MATDSLIYDMAEMTVEDKAKWWENAKIREKMLDVGIAEIHLELSEQRLVQAQENVERAKQELYKAKNDLEELKAESKGASNVDSINSI
jgi:hypothetical protein